MAKVNTEVDITVPDSEDGYVVRPNENIYIQCPNYEDATTYSTSVKFEYWFMVVEAVISIVNQALINHPLEQSTVVGEDTCNFNGGKINGSNKSSS